MRRALLITFLLTVATGAANPQRSADVERAYQDMVAAQRALEAAKQQRDRLAQKQDQGSEFFEKQRALEREVALKQWRYDQARERFATLSEESS